MCVLYEQHVNDFDFGHAYVYNMQSKEKQRRAWRLKPPVIEIN